MNVHVYRWSFCFYPDKICPGIYIHFSVNWGCDDFFFIIQLVPKVVGHWQWVLKDWWWFPQQSSKIDIWISCDSVKGQHDNIPSWERFFCFGSLVYIKMGISNGVHPILTIRCFVFCEVPTLGSNFEIYKLFRHVHGVFDKGMFLAQTLFIYTYIHDVFLPALLAASAAGYI